eukprot:1157309-Pelagomonas_calceolata.AAC.8
MQQHGHTAQVALLPHATFYRRSTPCTLADTHKKMEMIMGGSSCRVAARPRGFMQLSMVRLFKRDNLRIDTHDLGCGQPSEYVCICI